VTAIAEPEQVIAPEHEEVHVRRGPRSGLTLTIAIHRAVGGRALGGCRLRAYATSDEAVRDAERLARAMTFKAGAAGLRIGGGKGVIAAPAHTRLSQDARRAALNDFAELIESFGGRYVSAQDVGTSEQDIAFMSTFTDHVAGRPVADGGCGDPSPYTAHGVEVAIRAGLGGPLTGRHVVVVGLGHVGGMLAARLARAGARLTVTDAEAAVEAIGDTLAEVFTRSERAGVSTLIAAQELASERGALNSTQE
jgi:leucine dehydrogenase